MPSLRLSPSEIAAHRGPAPSRLRDPAPSRLRDPALSRLRDPAPSRLGYRINRLWLTPAFRSALQYGLPLALLLAVVGGFVADPDNRAAIVRQVTETRRSIETRPEFMVRLMAVDGASPVLAETVRELLPLHFPVSSFDLDLPAMQARIAALDVVESVKIMIRPGGVMQVSITEREPVLVWRRNEAVELVDRAGHRVATLANRAARADLPLIAGWNANRAVDEALALYREAGRLAAHIRGLVRVGERRWDIVLDDGPVILLPEHEPLVALAQVLALDETENLLARAVTHVDMRDPRRPTLRLIRNATAGLVPVRETRE